MGTLIVIVLAVIVAGALITIYNSLIQLKNKSSEAWSDIDTQLTRRHDLIPNLIETVKGYASHESATLEKVTEARNQAVNAKSVKEKEVAETGLAQALRTVFAIAENYPDLKANQNFLDLQKNLSEIEEHIQLSRRYYNATVRDLNTKIESFPSNLIATAFRFEKREFFEADEEEKQNVKVDFSGNTGNPTQTTASPSPTPPETPSQPPQEKNPPEQK